MNYVIAKTGKITEIVIDGVSGKTEQDALVQVLNPCKTGSCECPSNQSTDLEQFDLRFSGRQLILTLKAKKGARFDVAKIEKSLASMTERAERES